MRSLLEGCAGERRGRRALLPVPLTSVLQGTGPSRGLEVWPTFQKRRGKRNTILTHSNKLV